MGSNSILLSAPEIDGDGRRTLAFESFLIGVAGVELLP